MSFLFSGSRDYDDRDEGSMFGPKPGTWWLSSKSDPRWNKSGTSYGFAFGLCYEADEWLKHCEKEFGAPPEDLETGFMKD